jgi:SAM-dependent methyltransferase
VEAPPPVTAQPGSPTAFEGLVDDYAAARPGYPDDLYDALGALGDALELGAGTGLSTRGLLGRTRSLVCTDLGPRMLGRAVHDLGVTAVVARAEQLPFADGSFDVVCGAQMWHWVDVGAAVPEVLRVLRPGGRLAVWWNEAGAVGQPWFEAQESLIEAANPAYRRGYCRVDRAAQLRDAGWPGPVTHWTTSWQRELDVELYLRWLRSKSYVDATGRVDELCEQVRAVLLEHFPSGTVVELFDVGLWVAVKE